ncbi:MAG: glycoside hydrolase family 3 C-terminal domain-containing protein [Prevotellaceae bacterium]|nr:glycoside hydrolase family 3 C-terminal domain-containing protein [Prevotellaceae bacterium]
MKKILTTLCLGIAVMASAQTYLDPNAPIEERVKDALSRMTLHEKVQILHAQSKFSSPGVPRLGIRQLNYSDGPHGAREEIEWNSWNAAHWTNDSCVAFPTLTCLASTWNRELSAVYGNAVSEEFAYRGKDVMLGPGVNIARVPLNGRAFEYMGEDPYLAGEMAVPYIIAAQKNGVATCPKHFLLNNQEKDRWTVNVNVSERAVEEIYLPAFEKVIKQGKAWTIMGSYNKWNNVWCCENDSSLNAILKKRWGFDGAVVSDWGGTHTTSLAAFGGLDIEMGTNTNGKTIDRSLGYNTYYLADNFEKMVREGKVPMSVLDDKASRVLRTIFRTAMNPKKVIGSMLSEAHYDVCSRIGEEGVVLLRNQKGILPVEQGKYRRILVVGDNATRRMSYGGGSSELKTQIEVSPLDGLKAVYGDAIDYAQGYYAGKTMYGKVEKLNPDSLLKLKNEALEKAKGADLIIYIGGMNKNHRQDCEDGDREDYNLSYGQNELIAELAKVQRNIIVVTFAGNAYATPWIDKVQALLQCWYLGSMSGRTLADIISGKVNPSGKLPVTFAKKQEDYPCFQYGKEGYPGVNRQVHYKEGIYVGYRHFDTHKVKPQFPFGYGMSYTTFKYGKPTITANTISDGETITVSVPVTNTGKREGKETVQLYITDAECSVDRPAKELKGFTKLTLAPGETKTATMKISVDDLRYYSEKEHRWIAEPGKFSAVIAASAEDIKGTAAFEYE